MKSLDLAKDGLHTQVKRASWRSQIDTLIDGWMTSPGFYRWAIGNPITRWVTRRRAAQLFELMAGFVHSQVLLSCVRLGLLEGLRDGPQTLDALSQSCQMKPAALQRLLHVSRVSHERSQSLRHVNGRAQTTHTFDGRLAFATTLPSASRMVRFQVVMRGGARACARSRSVEALNVTV